MTLAEPVVFAETAIASLRLEPGEEIPQVRLFLRAPLSPELARVLCPGKALYTEDGQPRQGWGTMPLDCTLEDAWADLSPPVPQIGAIRMIPSAIEQFRVASRNGALEVSFRMSIAGRAQELCAFAIGMGQGSFHLSLESSQMSLFAERERSAAADPRAELNAVIGSLPLLGAIGATNSAKNERKNPRKNSRKNPGKEKRTAKRKAGRPAERKTAHTAKPRRAGSKIPLRRDGLD